MHEVLKPVYKNNMHPAWQDWIGPEIGLRILLARRQVLESWNFENLMAPHWRLYHCGGVGARILLDGKSHHLVSNKLWLVPPDVIFSAHNDHPVPQLYVHFLIQPKWHMAAPKIFPVMLTDRLKQSLDLPETSNDPWLNACVVQNLVMEALVAIPGKHFVTELVDPRASLLIRLMTNEPGKNWSNAELATKSGFHPQALMRWFRQHTGTTPRKFLLEIRLREASLQLLYTRRSIEEIAARMGFYDRYHFTRAFTSFRGIPPASYRKQRDQWPVQRLENDIPWV